MNYKEALSILKTAEDYGTSISDYESFTEEEVIKYAEDITKYADALEAETTGN